MTEVVLNGVGKVFPGDVHAVRDVHLRIGDGELFVLLGPSGCGKSTILRMIAGLEEATSGELWLNGGVANDLSPRERNVAMVFQDGALYPHRTVGGNMMFPLEVAGGDRAEARERVAELTRALGIGSMIDRLPGTLSGGQRQRAAIGRALIRQPSLFLMDEPLSSLDAGLRTELRLEITGLVRSTGTTTVYVTHDQVEAMTMADRIAVLRDGVLEDVGTPEQIYRDPATVFVAAFLSSPPINLLQATAWAVQDRGVVLDFGPQQVTVPWNDARSPALISHHGGPVIVGLRPDALTPVAAGEAGRTLAGRVRVLEFHGHDWLAYAEAGIPTVDAAAVGPGPASPGAASSGTAGAGPGRERPGPGGLAGRVRGLIRRPAPPEPVEEEHAGHHRRSDLVFSTGSRRPERGAEVRLDVDLDRMLVFGPDGRRITAVRR
ncbi:ABC transporter ATP-binding protein [Actinomadura rugatobispora]|uniref:ABC transporter ATP-binding protein n=1 Tax=Actinomadura rugatobispora TaxID=1994 RepID=A0ABW1A6C9_9ACTN|nr:ABC transporter ATP-binding protein [Actinomadura rugatobispora]